MVLSQRNDAVSNTSAEGTEITGIGLEIHVGKFVDDRIERFLEERENLSFTSAILVGSNYIIFRLLVQNLNHVSYNFRPLLQVRINKCHIFTGGLLQSGVDCRLFAEVTGETYHFYGTFLRLKDLTQLKHSGIFAAVIHKDNLIIITAVTECFNHSFLECGNIFGFIITGGYQGKFHTDHSQFGIFLIIFHFPFFVKTKLNLLCKNQRKVNL